MSRWRGEGGGWGQGPDGDGKPLVGGGMEWMHCLDSRLFGMPVEQQDREGGGFIWGGGLASNGGK